MKITLTEISEPIELVCPHCSAPLLLVSKHEMIVPGGGYFLDDGDTVDGFYRELTPEQQNPSGYWCELLQGSRPCCGKGYIVIQDICINGPFLDAFAREFMCHDVGVTTFLLASRGPERWIVGKRETPLGPMLSHQFGPFAWDDTSWIGPHGVTSCRSSFDNAYSPWRFADAYLLERWDDLQELIRCLPVPESAAAYIASHPDEARQEVRK